MLERARAERQELTSERFVERRRISEGKLTLSPLMRAELRVEIRPVMKHAAGQQLEENSLRASVD